MSLETYRRKRNFGVTPEPRGKADERGGGKALSFVIQKHAARRLHYDFRLELDGTLKSWAVPRGPSIDPADKRLAVQVEDHPLDYASFEGTIPEHEYGAGSVIVWDRGTWIPRGDPHAGLRNGELKFELSGEKVKGGWVLVRMDGRAAAGKENWLLIKERDDRVERGRGSRLVDEAPQSVVSGRTLEDIAGSGGKRSPAKPPPARTAGRRQAAAQRDAAPAGEPAPARESSTGKAAPVGEAAPTGKAAPVRESAPAGKAAPGREVAPTGKAAPARETAPAGKDEPAREAAAAAEAAPAGEAAVARAKSARNEQAPPAREAAARAKSPRREQAPPAREAAVHAKSARREQAPPPDKPPADGTRPATARRPDSRRPAGEASRDPARADNVVQGVLITHPERVLYPESGITKLDVARYYEAVAPALLPYIAQRPISIVRCPAGPGGECFFQKHAAGREIPGIAVAMIEESKGLQPYLVANDAKALAGLAQMGAIELHAWGGKADAIERPDTLIFDFDPDPSVTWDRVVDAAFVMRERLADCGLESFVKTTGGKGLHVVAPIARRIGWDELKSFAHALAARFAGDEPDAFTTNMSKAERHGRVFIDYLRNGRGATAVAPWSLRAREHATVAMPISWDELRAGARPEDFTLRTATARLAQGQDPWAAYPDTRQSLTAAARRKAGA